MDSRFLCESGFSLTISKIKYPVLPGTWIFHLYIGKFDKGLYQ